MTFRSSRAVWCISLAAFAFSSALHAAPPPSLDTLANEVARAVNKSRSDASNPARDGANSLQDLVWQVADLWRDGNLDGAEQGLRSLIEKSPSEAIAEQGRALLTQVSKEKEERNARFLSACEEIFKEAAGVCAKAQKATELDPLLARFQALSTSIPRARDSRVQRAMEQARSASRFLKKWQDYLAATSAQDFRTAGRVLEQLTDDAVGNLFIPRSEVLRLSQAAETAQVTVLRENAPARLAGTLHTMDDVTRVLDSARSSRRSDDDDDSAPRFYAVLKHLQSGSYELKAGNAARAIELASESFDQAEGIFPSAVLEAFSRVQRDLLLRALPAALDLPASRGPARDESPTDYLLRILKEAKDSRDWFLMSRVLDCYAKIIGGSRRGSADWVNIEKQALNHFVVARNQEKAGDIEGALRSYEAALRLPSHHVPADQIGESVTALKRMLRDSQLPAVEK
jgi:tetratricopeptide (TPR) repeat protein